LAGHLRQQRIKVVRRDRRWQPKMTRRIVRVVRIARSSGKLVHHRIVSGGWGWCWQIQRGQQWCLQVAFVIPVRASLQLRLRMVHYAHRSCCRRVPGDFRIGHSDHHSGELLQWFIMVRCSSRWGTTLRREHGSPRRLVEESNDGAAAKCLETNASALEGLGGRGDCPWCNGMIPVRYNQN
jgi:hypothetical protein